MSYRSGSILSAALMLALISVPMLGLGGASGAGFEEEWAGLLQKAQEEGEVVAERKAGVYSLDVWMGGITSVNTRLLPAKAVDPIKPLLIHPEVLGRG